MTRRSGEVAPVVGENAETASSVRAGDELEGAPDINFTITGGKTKGIGIIIILEDLKDRTLAVVPPCDRVVGMEACD